MAKFLKLIKNEKGATAIEYGLIAALIAVAAIAAMSNIGTSLNETFSEVASALYAERLFERRGAAASKGAAAFFLPIESADSHHRHRPAATGTVFGPG